MKLFSAQVEQWMRIKHWQNDTDWGKPQNLENKSYAHFVHHKFHIDWLGGEHGPLLWKLGDWLAEPWHSCNDSDEYYVTDQLTDCPVD
jgi:hypothetical protein